MKTKSFFFAAALSVLALLSVSCSKDIPGPITPTTDNGLLTSEESVLVLTGTKWRALDSYDRVIGGTHLLDEDEYIVYFTTDSTGIGTHRAIIRANHPAEEVIDNTEQTFNIVYTIDKSTVWIAGEGEDPVEHTYNEINQTLTRQRFVSYLDPLVYHRMNE